MEIEKSYVELFQFDSVAASYIARLAPQDNKLTKSAQKVFKQLQAHFLTYDESVDDLKTSHCLTIADGEKKGAIVYDEITNKAGEKERIRCFSPEGELKLKAEVRSLLKQKVKIHSRIAAGVEELIPSLTENERVVFSGIIIPVQETENDVE